MGSNTVPSAHPMSGMEAFAPAEIAALVETRGVTKANAPIVTTFVLGVLAGAFIALGAVLATMIGTGSELGFGITRWLAGIGFSLGLILVVVAGAELFTGNNLIVMSVVSGKVSVARLLRNWAIVYAGNFVGAASIAVMVWLGDWGSQGDGSVGASALAIAATKATLPFWTIFWRAVLANALVCLAVWLATGGRTIVDKVFAIVFPISAFVAAGFEHSVANMYFIPIGLLLERDLHGAPHRSLAGLDMAGFGTNLAAATLGNVVGGALLVGLVYWFVYLRPRHDA
ncbi:MAG: formate/nitrite transporter family protein [Actinomycetota bacterium]|nr:formate/nitrite transporter family protein [Actinomycetota bacterium]MDH5225424.1 formate/nitrite transporter family protein [Actinomycetota bacterium]MDH5314180.1 formate/nitrite transporter family protein [Actinomycetota bacterium]